MSLGTSLSSIINKLEPMSTSDCTIYLRYYGATVASTPEARFLSDFGSDSNRLFNLISKSVAKHPLWTSRDVQWDIYEWTSKCSLHNPTFWPQLTDLDISTPISTYEYRAAHHLQAVERALICLTSPYNLNVARGGLRHIPSLDVFTRSPLLSRLTTHRQTAADIAIRQLLSDQVDMSVRLRKSLNQDPPPVYATPSALSLIKSQLHDSLSIVEGRVASIQLSSDITIEALHHRNPEVHYTGRLAGPGPSLACRARLAALGLTSEEVEEAYISKKVPGLIGPFTDMYPASTKHEGLWLELLMLIRLLRIVKPTIIRAEGRETTAILAGDYLSHAFPDTPSRRQNLGIERFLEGRSECTAVDIQRLCRPTFLELRWETIGPSDFTPWVGHLFVARVGPQRNDLALVVPNVSTLT